MTSSTTNSRGRLVLLGGVGLLTVLAGFGIWSREHAEGALAAGMTRLRPVIMTALAMIIGMLPMSLGLGEGGEQNAPLGRAVIGGLIFATCATLLFVPVIFSIFHGRTPRAADGTGPGGTLG